jgi:hypothetical protein
VAAQRHLQPPADMSPIELYSNYVNATSCLRLERAETKRLKSTLDHLDLMIQERSAAIQLEREEAAMVKSSHQSLEHKHSEAVQRCKELQDEIVDLHRKQTTGDIRLKKLTQENDDLSNQVRQLLYRDVRVFEIGKSMWYVCVHALVFVCGKEVREESGNVLTPLIPFCWFVMYSCKMLGWTACPKKIPLILTLLFHHACSHSSTGCLGWRNNGECVSGVWLTECRGGGGGGLGCWCLCSRF